MIPASLSSIFRWAALLLAVAEAVRSVVDQEALEGDQDDVGTDPVDVKKLFADPNRIICGGDSIRTFLTAPKDSDEVRNIPWTQVYAIADEYIKTRTADSTRLRAEVERLRAEIPIRVKAEAPKLMSAEQMAASLNTAFATAGGYGTIDQARASKCGAAATRPRAPKGAFAATAAAFPAAVRQLLSSGAVAVDGAAFSKACQALLGVDAAATDSNCPELCQQLSESATKVSDEFVTARAVNGKSSDQLRKELDEQTALLKLSVLEVDGCTQTKADLNIFRSQLQGLQAEISNTHNKLKDARDSLMDAQYDLDDLQESVRVQAAEAKTAQDVLQGAGKVAQAALAQVQVATQQLGGLQGASDQAKKELDNARTVLKETQEASDTLNALKQAVSESMLSMVMYFDDAVRNPVRAMGLSEKVSVDKLFPAPPTALGSAAAAKMSIKTLSNFCAEPDTQQVLAAATTDKLDTRSLCAIGDVAKINSDVDGAVQETTDLVKQSLREVQSWLDPYKGQPDVNKATADANFEQGEPRGLREVISTFSKTTYYRQYLQHWALKGKFLELYHAVFEALRKAEAAHGSAAARLAALTAQLLDSQKALAAAQAALQVAVQANDVAKGKEAEAQKLLQSMTATSQGMQRKLQELERAVAEATRQWQAAKGALQETHKQGTSLIEYLQALEDSF